MIWLLGALLGLSLTKRKKHNMLQAARIPSRAELAESESSNYPRDFLSGLGFHWARSQKAG